MSEPIEGRVVRVSGAQAALYPHLTEAHYASWREREEDARKARMAERAGHGSWEEWINSALGVKLERWQSNVLGQWQETPREELQRRLNSWLRGTYPGEPINWKGLS